jgi:hypothetical protein
MKIPKTVARLLALSAIVAGAANPVSHYQNSYNNDQKMRREVDAES